MVCCGVVRLETLLCDLYVHEGHVNAALPPRGCEKPLVWDCSGVVDAVNTARLGVQPLTMQCLQAEAQSCSTFTVLQLFDARAGMQLARTNALPPDSSPSSELQSKFQNQKKSNSSQCSISTAIIGLEILMEIACST